VLTVEQPGLQTLVVDAGRMGLGHLGVPRSGALDPVCLARANALVGNPAAAAGLECLLRGPVLTGQHLLAAAGPGWQTTADGYLDLRRLPRPLLRVWVAVAGGLQTPPTLGSRSADLLGGLGPPPLRAGDVLPVGPAPGPPYAAPAPGLGPPGPLALLPGPDGRLGLGAGPWLVTRDSDRVALRLAGPASPHATPGRTRGLVPGAVQLPPDGRPVVFLAGHPATGGYPVVGVVAATHLGLLAQLRPGDALMFAWVSSAA